MKRNKILFGLAALVIAFGLVFSMSAFKSNETKKTTLYWYKVSHDDPTNYPDGYIKNDSDFYVEEEKPLVVSPCATGNEIECLRGFSSELSNFPNDDAATESIMRPAL